ncbi:MAG: outer membrane protein assembly factor BamA [Desulfobacterales bacterium]|nr:outer membrane protein assembly factor BamA [Desulfobacterales bacterium]
MKGQQREMRRFYRRPYRRRILQAFIMGPALAALLLAVAVFPGAPFLSAQTAGIQTGEDLPVIDEIRVEVDVPGEDPAPWQALVRRLSFFQEGDRLDAEALTASLDALRLSREFKSINVDTVQEGGRTLLVYGVVPADRLGRIALAGNYPLFRRDVLEAMTLYPGAALFLPELDTQAERIAKRFRGDGFSNPRVSVSAQRVDSGRTYDLDVRIDKGAWGRLEEIQVNGNHLFAANALRPRMKTWWLAKLPGPVGRFVESDLAADVTALTDRYRGKGYADVRVDDSLERLAPGNGYRATLSIDEGDRYQVAFKGNRYFSDRVLRQDITLFQTGNAGGSGIRRSMNRILDRYRRDGFASVQVRTRQERVSEPNGFVRRVDFVVEEGPRTRVVAVTFDGNTFFDADALGPQMLTHRSGLLNQGPFDPDLLQEDLAAIRTLYLSEGYLDATVAAEPVFDPGREAVTVRVRIGEGVQTRVEAVNIKGWITEPVAEALAAVSLQAGEPYRPYRVREDEQALAGLVSEKGYPHVQVTSDTVFNADRTGVRIVFRIEKGPFVEMGTIHVTGNLRTQPSVVLREQLQATGQPLSMVRLLGTQRAIRDLEVFSSVQFHAIGLKEKADTVHMMAAVEEKPPYFVEAGVGYENDSGAYARLRIGDNNLMGLNKRAWAGAAASQTGQRFETGLFEPRLLGSRLSADTGLFFERKEPFNQTFGTDTQGATLSFGYALTGQLRSALKLSYENREPFDREGGRIAYLQVGRRQILVVTPSVAFDSRDAFVRPRKGAVATAAVDISNGLDTDDDDFAKFSLDGRGYFSPTDRLTLAIHGRLDHITPFGDAAAVPEDQRLFLGGTTTVRGFGENLLRTDAGGEPVGGLTAAMGNVEARWALGGNMELSGFVDAGQVMKPALAAGPDRMRWSTGVGLRYVTPIGAMGVLYGHKIDPDPGEARGRFHISIGYTF